jgi:hypothetical protein
MSREGLFSYRLDDNIIYDKTEYEHGRDNNQEGKERIPEIVHKYKNGDIHAHDYKGTVGEINYFHYTQDQRKSDGKKGINAAH